MKREDWNHVCDYGMVNATYMIDEGANDVTPGNPPQELPYWGSPKWSDEPRSHDPDRSPWFEKAVWFIPIHDGDRPIPEQLTYVGKLKYWIRVDDNVGSWRIAEAPNHQQSIEIIPLDPQWPTGTVPPRSKICRSGTNCGTNNNQWEYPPYYEINARIVVTNPDAYHAAVELQIYDYASGLWNPEVVDGQPQRCIFTWQRGKPTMTFECHFKLNTLSRAGAGTQPNTQPLRYRVVAVDNRCENDMEERSVNIYPQFACPIASTAAGHNCGGYCYHARRGTGGDHDGVDINGNNLGVSTPCGGRFRIRRNTGTCDPNQNANQRRINSGPGYGRYADVTCTFQGGAQLTLRFAHLSSITHTRSTIGAGEEVGISDATGNACYCGPSGAIADNPHLHFEVQGYDPKRFLPDSCPNDNYAILDSDNRSRCCRANTVVIRDCTQEPAMCLAQ